jgi:hypothetical protein
MFESGRITSITVRAGDELSEAYDLACQVVEPSLTNVPNQVRLASN